MVRAIGEERLFRDILSRYHYSTDHPEDITSDMIKEISGIFMYNKEQIAVKLGTSRTTPVSYTHLGGNRRLRQGTPFHQGYDASD